MVSVLALSAVDRVFEPRLGQTKDYEIGICCFSAKYAALRKRAKTINHNKELLHFKTLDIITLHSLY
jgi:hypothetical protein